MDDGNLTARRTFHRLNLFQGVRPFIRAQILKDVVAGITLSAMNIPQVLGYTRIAGTPVVTGLYTLLLPLVAFAAFGSSRYLVVSADSATAAILAGGLANIASVASARHVALAGLVALMTGGCLIVARFLKLGFLADFLSQTVLVGFLTGVGFQVSLAVLGEMLGIQVHSPRTVRQLSEVATRLAEVHLPTLFISVVTVGSILAFRRFAPIVPGPLIAVVGAIIASASLDFAGHSILVVGPVAGGLPALRLPELSLGGCGHIVPGGGLMFCNDRRSKRCHRPSVCDTPSAGTRRERGFSGSSRR